MATSVRYNRYSEYLKQAYGEKVYKLPVNLPVTCPNRDGKIGYGGCAFCGDKGAGFEMLESTISVVEQLSANKSYIEKKYKAKKFIAYFQNFCNTYLPLRELLSYIEQALSVEDMVGVAIATRPDCLLNEQLEALQAIQKSKNVNITIELGLQTANYNTLLKMNRGHTLGEFIDAVLRCQKYNLRVCTHVILNLPNDEMADAVETAKIISALPVQEVKLHALYIVHGTLMAKWYMAGEIQLIGKEEYIKRAIAFLRHLRKDIVVQRLIGRAPKADTLFANWNSSWWLIHEMIENGMQSSNVLQGDQCNYIGGYINKKNNSS